MFVEHFASPSSSSDFKPHRGFVCVCSNANQIAWLYCASRHSNSIFYQRISLKTAFNTLFQVQRKYDPQWMKRGKKRVAIANEIVNPWHWFHRKSIAQPDQICELVTYNRCDGIFVWHFLDSWHSSVSNKEESFWHRWTIHISVNSWKNFNRITSPFFYSKIGISKLWTLEPIKILQHQIIYLK